MNLIIFEFYPPYYGCAARKFLKTAKSELFTWRYNILMQKYMNRIDSNHLIQLEWVRREAVSFSVRHMLKATSIQNTTFRICRPLLAS